MSSIIEPLAKKLKPTKTMGTHSGSFHADEALGISLLRRTAEFKDAELTRTRDQKILDSLDIVIDVGAVYNPSTHRYDHHQKTFDEVFGDGTFPFTSQKLRETLDGEGGRELKEGREFDVKLSSAGLVWKHFGKHIISQVHGWGESEPRTEQIWLKMYDTFVQAIDGNDNGIPKYTTDLKPRYSDRTNLPGRVGALNPRWNEESNDRILDEKFEKASALAGSEFFDRLDFYINAWMPARDLVREAIEWRVEVDSSGQIVVFKQSMPWKDHLYELESELLQTSSSSSEILYALYPESSDKPEGKWRIQCVPVKGESFKNRKDIVPAWKGLRDEQLSEVSGIPGCIFVHASGFTGGNMTKEGALAMARASVAYQA